MNRWERFLDFLSWGKREPPPTKIVRYGYNNTIHDSTVLDVEIDGQNQEVVAVWFRCMLLPFKCYYVNESRADEMRSATSPAKLLAVDIELEK